MKKQYTFKRARLFGPLWVLFFSPFMAYFPLNFFNGSKYVVAGAFVMIVFLALMATRELWRLPKHILLTESTLVVDYYFNTDMMVALDEIQSLSYQVDGWQQIFAITIYTSDHTRRLNVDITYLKEKDAFISDLNESLDP